MVLPGLKLVMVLDASRVEETLGRRRKARRQEAMKELDALLLQSRVMSVAS